MADGVTKTIEGLITHLPAHGIEVEIWEFARGIARLHEERIHDVRVVKLPAPRGHRLPWISQPTADALAQIRASIDLLHLHSVFRAENLWAARTGIPYVLTPNGGYSPGVVKGRRRWLKQIWMQLWERRLWSRARFLHAVSEGEAAELALLANAPRVVVIPNGVHTIDRRPIRQPAANYWLFMGRLSTRQKGLDLLLPAFAIAKGRCRMPPLRIVGPDFRGERTSLHALAVRLGIATDVTFDGALFGEEKRHALENAALLIQTSRWEGMPFSVLEAMATGAPVLVTGGTNLAGIVAASDAGWTCDGTIGSIANAMCAVANSSEEERTRKGRNAQQLIAERFTWPRLAGEMAAAYAGAFGAPTQV
jgi:glycosyltransferase involved in cell wall biosynthesis